MINVILITLNLLWLGIMAMQSFELLNFGTKLMPKGWLLYCILAVLVFIVVDLKIGNGQNFIVNGYIILFLYFVIFNIAIIFDLYIKFPILNRFEHLLFAMGFSYLISNFVVFFKFSGPIKNDLFHLFIVFSIFNIAIVFHEIVELLLDIFLSESNVGPSVLDTNLDLAMGWLGFGLYTLILNITRLIKI